MIFFYVKTKAINIICMLLYKIKVSLNKNRKVEKK